MLEGERQELKTGPAVEFILELDPREREEESWLGVHGRVRKLHPTPAASIPTVLARPTKAASFAMEPRVGHWQAGHRGQEKPVYCMNSPKPSTGRVAAQLQRAKHSSQDPRSSGFLCFPVRSVASEYWVFQVRGRKFPGKEAVGRGSLLRAMAKYSPTTKTSEREFSSWGLRGTQATQLPSQGSALFMVTLGAWEEQEDLVPASRARQLGAVPPADAPGWLPGRQITTKYGQKNA